MADLLVSIVTAAATSASLVWLTRTWISERLRSSIRHEYECQLEEFKRRLELEFEDHVRRRRLYEDLSNSLEQVFGSGEMLDRTAISLLMNKLFAMLALYAPDDVYIAVKNAVLNKKIYGRDVKPVIYHALRKSLLGERTSLEANDLIDHLDVTHVPSPNEKSGRAS
jgi:hypothetical protein